VTRTIRSGRGAWLAVAAAAALTLALAPAASATVPPKNCGMLSVKGKRYQIKADQIRCSTAKTYSRRYLSSGTRPSGYRCSNYGASTKLEFRCSKRVRVFFAIRR
jgi:hypothetical protein